MNENTNGQEEFIALALMLQKINGVEVYRYIQFKEGEDQQKEFILIIDLHVLRMSSMYKKIDINLWDKCQFATDNIPINDFSYAMLSDTIDKVTMSVMEFIDKMNELKDYYSEFSKISMELNRPNISMVERHLCPKCGITMFRDDSIIYTSNPPQYKYECPNCGNISYDTK